MIQHFCVASSSSRTRRALIAASLYFGALLASRVSFAEAPNVARTEADRLFEQGRASLKAQRYEAACFAFAESERLDPAAGTLVNWALCLEAQGKTASAWTTYRAALSLGGEAPDPAREELARARIGALEPALCRVTVVLPPDQPPALVVALDETPLDASTLNRAIPVDPGAHVVSASATGRRPWSESLMFREPGASHVIPIPALTPATPTAPSATTRFTAGPLPVTPPRSEPAPNVRWEVAASGAVALGGALATIYFAARADAAWNTRESHCSLHRCDAEAVRAGDRAYGLAHAADVGGVVAGLALGSAVFFALLPMRSPRTAVLPFELTLNRSFASATLRGDLP